MRLAVSICVSVWVSCLLLGGAPAPVYGAEVMPPVHIDVTAPPARLINDYHLFRDVAQQLPNEGLIPFSINTPLFADYAEKYRFVYLPPGAQAIYNSEDAFTFPVGTVMVKTFSYLHDRRDPTAGERILETRLLMHRPEGWVGYPYVWNDDLSDARLAVAGARIPVSWIHNDGAPRETRYTIPNMNECKHCHENNQAMGPIGPKARQLNRFHDYGVGETHQLHAWIRRGILAEAPDDLASIPIMPPWNDGTVPLDIRARSYLDGNCAHCHNPGGDAGPTGLDLRWFQKEPVAYGINKLPTAAGPSSRGYKYAIRPARPDRSFLLSRLRATDPALMMPRTGRTIPHDEGIALIESWIAEMDPNLSSLRLFEDTP